MSRKGSKEIQPIQPVEGADAPCKYSSLVKNEAKQIRTICFPMNFIRQITISSSLMSLSDEENISFNDDRREMSVKGELVGDAGVVEEDNGKAYMKSSLIALHQVV